MSKLNDWANSPTVSATLLSNFSMGTMMLARQYAHDAYPDASSDTPTLMLDVAKDAIQTITTAFGAHPVHHGNALLATVFGLATAGSTAAMLYELNRMYRSPSNRHSPSVI